MSFKESFKVNGENLLKKVKELIEEGNVRKITINEKNGKELMSFPLTLGVVGAVFLPGACCYRRSGCIGGGMYHHC